MKGKEDGELLMNGSDTSRSFFQREWPFVIVVVIGLSLYSLNLYSRFTGPDEPQQDKPQPEEAAEPRYVGLPPDLSEKIERIEATANEWRSLGPEEVLAAVRKNPKMALAMTILGSTILAISGASLLGLGVLFWFFRRLLRRQPTIAPQYSEKPQWGIWEFAIVFSVLMILNMLLGTMVVAMKAFGPVFETETALIVFAMIPAELLACAFGARLVWRRYRHRLDVLGVTGRRFWRNVGIGLLATFAMWPCVLIVRLTAFKIMQALNLPLTYNPAIEIIGEGRSVGMLLLAGLCAGTVIPVIEEFLFRGFLYGALRRSMGAAASIVLSAAIFAAFHLNPVDFFPLFVAGVFMAYLFEKTRSLVACSVVHILLNSSAMVVVLTLQMVP